MSRFTRRALLATLGGATSFGGCLGRSDLSDLMHSNSVRLIAHRGCADQYPENTRLAVEQSAPHVDMIEIDVQQCGSGELVVFHDDTLDRLTDATGSVATTDWDALRDLTVLDTDQTIPRLTDVFEWLPSETGLNIELKHDGFAERLLEVTAGADYELLYSSFSAKALRELRALDPDLPLAFITHDSPDISRSIALDLDCVAIHPSYDLVLDSQFVERAHEDGLPVNTWTIDDSETAERVVEAGVDGVIADRWDVLAAG